MKKFIAIFSLFLVYGHSFQGPSFESGLKGDYGHEKYSEKDPRWKVLKDLYSAYQSEYNVSEEYLIPKIIHLIWIGKPIPERCQKVVESWKKFHPDWIVKVWGNKDALAFKFQNQEAFDTAKNYSEKSDIWRQELLYQYGGIYADTDQECLQSFDSLNRTAEFFIGIGHGEPEVWCGIIGSRPYHPFMQSCVENTMVGNGDNDIGRIMEGGPYFVNRMFMKFITENPNPGKVVAFPTSVFYPFPPKLRFLLKDRKRIKDKYVRPETMSIQYHDCSWQPGSENYSF
jgi:mannosyltransferase OCH1-like enzyme